MSYSGRDGCNANSAIVVTVSPEDFGGNDILDGMHFQRNIEKAAFNAAAGKVPYQLNEDFQKGIASESVQDVIPQIKGLCAPGALVKDGKVHLFYQTYGNGKKDAICHAISDDGIHFRRNPTNPIFHPAGDWTCGRAIDAEVCEFKGRYFLYFATRDKNYDIQMQGVAVAPGNTNFNREDWVQVTDSSILYPVYPWEGKCIEGASIAKKGDKLYMFYAGAYNNAPQQIGVAESEDGIVWKRLSEEPFLKNGKPGEWNSSESGHPHIFTDLDGRTYLFYQGNNDNGKTWYITQEEVVWKNGKPFLKGK